MSKSTISTGRTLVLEAAYTKIIPVFSLHIHHLLVGDIWIRRRLTYHKVPPFNPFPPQHQHPQSPHDPSYQVHIRGNRGVGDLIAGVVHAYVRDGPLTDGGFDPLLGYQVLRVPRVIQEYTKVLTSSIEHVTIV